MTHHRRTTLRVRHGIAHRCTSRRLNALVATALVGVALSTMSLAAQEATPEGMPAGLSLTVGDAVRLALENYPAVQEQHARARAAEQDVAAARTAYLPRIDTVWQENRATHNNVFGLLFPQGVIPPVSGPVLPATWESVWGSAAGALVSWEALDFGLRKANVNVARAQQAAATARIALTELDAAGAAADACLTVLAADAGVRAAQANVDRLQVVADAVRTLVGNQLRAGVDQSRAEAELAMARNQLTQGQQAADVARAALAAAIGRPGSPVTVIPGRLVDMPAAPAVPGGVEAHPATRLALAAVDIALAREQALDRSALPHITLQSAATARGSGAVLAGFDDTSGAWPRVSNWAAGVSVSFPVMDVFTVRPRRRAEGENEVADRAAYRQTVLTLTVQQARAVAAYKAAVAIAQNMPTVLAAARQTEQLARARYDNALGTITDVADAERLLAQAETDDAVARLGVWRALLAEAQAAGDLTQLLEQLRNP